MGPQVAPGPGIRLCPLTARASPWPVSPNTQDPLPGLSAGSIPPHVWPTSGAGLSVLRCLLPWQRPRGGAVASSRTGPSCPGSSHARWWKGLAWAISTPDPPVTCREACLTPVCGSQSCLSVPSPPAPGGGGHPHGPPLGARGLHQAPDTGTRKEQGDPPTCTPLTSGDSLRHRAGRASRGRGHSLSLIWPCRPRSGTLVPPGRSPARPAFPHSKAEANLGSNWTISRYLTEGPATPGEPGPLALPEEGESPGAVGWH